MHEAEFIGRRQELLALEDRYKERKSQFVVVYGRRRVGKSALLRTFAHRKRAVFHVGDRSTKPLQIKKVLEAAAEAFEAPILREVSVQEWHRLFEVLTPYLAKQKTLLIFDEFQWMCEGSPELPSVIQKFWDQTWEKSRQAYLVLCGSYVGFMEREVLGKKSPLFGRRTAQVRLKPFSFRDARLFHSRYGDEDAARVYGICGGIPAYLLAFDPARSVDQNLLRECLEEEGRLREEPRFLMMEELREPSVYYSLLECLNTHRVSITELARQMGMDRGSLVYYLKTLMNLGYTEKVIPLGSRTEGKGRGHYRISDSLLRFWFSQVYPQLTDLTLRGPREVFVSKIKPHLESFWAGQFEALCREAVPHLMQHMRVTAPYRVGVFWNRETQIDLVIEREDGVTHIGECKWLHVPVGMEVVNELRQKMKSYANPRHHMLLPLLFSRKGFTKAVLQEPHLQRFALSDLYRL